MEDIELIDENANAVTISDSNPPNKEKLNQNASHQQQNIQQNQDEELEELTPMTSDKNLPDKNDKPQNSKQLKSIKNKVQSTFAYPTQYLKIGELHCIFLSFYKKGRSPLFSIGPSWPFTIGLLVFAIGAAIYFTFMLNVLKKIDQRAKTVQSVLIALNFLALIIGILQNPGVPQSVFDFKLKQQVKIQRENSENGVNSDSDFDEESKSVKESKKLVGQKLKHQQNRPSYYNMNHNPHFCEDCNLQKDLNTYHCEDCDVCIMNMDHHCMFFSKCIGGGNIIAFWASIIGIFVVFSSFGVLVVVDALIN
eukprot:403338472